MFKYSLVYALRSSEHPLSKHVASCASRLGTSAFVPHITARHSMSFDEAMSLHRVFREHYDIPRIHCLNAINITSTILFNANGKRTTFYALEQPVLLNGLRVPGLHVSLAYKVGCPFTLSEMNKVSPWLGPLLEPSELSMTIWSCHAKSPRFWRKILNGS